MIARRCFRSVIEGDKTMRTEKQAALEGYDKPGWSESVFLAFQPKGIGTKLFGEKTVSISTL